MLIAKFGNGSLERNEVLTEGYIWSISIYGRITCSLGQQELGESYCRRALALARQLGNTQTHIGTIWMLWDTCIEQDYYHLAYEIIEETIDLARKATSAECYIWGASLTLGITLLRHGFTNMWMGYYDEARKLFQECIDLCAQAGDQYISGKANLLLAEMACLEGSAQVASPFLEACCVLFEALGMTMTHAESLCYLGWLALSQGDLEKAYECLARSLALHEQAEYFHGISFVQCLLARTLLAKQDISEAQKLLTSSLSIATRMYDKWLLAFSLDGWAHLASVQDEPIWAARLWAASELLHEKMGAPLAFIEEAERKPLMKIAQATLGSTTFQQSWQEGRASSVEEIITAHSEALPTTSARRPSSSASSSLSPAAIAAGLTPREMDVLRLLAEGLTNKQIADHLILSVVTVNSYLRSVYNKLDVTSRTAATRYALDHHLL